MFDSPSLTLNSAGAPVNRPANPYTIDQPLHEPTPDDPVTIGIPEEDDVTDPYDNHIVLGWTTDRDNPETNPTDALDTDRLHYIIEHGATDDRRTKTIYTRIRLGDTFTFPSRDGAWAVVGIHKDDPRHMLFKRLDEDDRLRTYMRADFAFKLSMYDHPDHGAGIERTGTIPSN